MRPEDRLNVAVTSFGSVRDCCPQVHGTSTNNPCALWASQMSSPSSKTAKLRRRSWTFSGGTNGKEQPPGERDRPCGCARRRGADGHRGSAACCGRVWPRVGRWGSERESDPAGFAKL